MGAGDSLEQWAERDRIAADRHILRGDMAAAARALRRADLKKRGRDGELWVGAELADLQQYGYRVLHDLVEPGRQRANIDHVLIGPCGLIVIDAKNWAGQPRVLGDQFRAGGRRREREIEHLRNQRAAILMMVARTPLGHTPALAALCFANPATDLPPHEHQGVTLLSLRYLEAWIRSRPAVLAPEEVDALAGHLGRVCQPAALPTSPPRAPRHVGDPRRPQSRRSARRRRARGRELLTGLAGLLLLSAVPKLATLTDGTRAAPAAVTEVPVLVHCPSPFWITQEFGRPVVAQASPSGVCRYADGQHPTLRPLIFAEAGSTLTRDEWAGDSSQATGIAGCGVFTDAATPRTDGAPGPAVAVGVCVVPTPAPTATQAAQAATFERTLASEIRSSATAAAGGHPTS